MVPPSSHHLVLRHWNMEPLSSGQLARFRCRKGWASSWLLPLGVVDRVSSDVLQIQGSVFGSFCYVVYLSMIYLGIINPSQNTLFQLSSIGRIVSHTYVRTYISLAVKAHAPTDQKTLFSYCTDDCSSGESSDQHVQIPYLHTTYPFLTFHAQTPPNPTASLPPHFYATIQTPFKSTL